MSAGWASVLAMATRDDVWELADRTVVAMAAAGISAAGPDAAALATVLVPFAEVALNTIMSSVSGRRRKHAAETLIDAADAAGIHSAQEFADFVQDAVSDEYKQELLVRALSIAQDTAMRDKRRALGRALASAVADNGTQ
jgi:hypothetical protein